LTVLGADGILDQLNGRARIHAMKAKTLKIAATATVLLLALSGLMYSTLSEGTEYYKHVDEVMVDPAAWHGKRLQLHGFVVDKSILQKPNTLDYRFDIQNNGKIVPARYTGVVPDTFKDGSEVVLKGRLGPHGFMVDPNGVMAKCPSKYEASRTQAAGT
jgi:cytochrome c-type biogenesis protein CcmE